MSDSKNDWPDEVASVQRVVSADSGTTYLIQSGEYGPVKIGYSACDVAIRLAALQTGSAEKLFHIGSVRGNKEGELHILFARFRLHGEWFRFNDEIAEAFEATEIATVRSKAPVNANGFLRPPAVAKRLGVSPDKVLGWIRSGKLKAVNVSDAMRPRWCISESDLQAFFESRMIRKEPLPRSRARSYARPCREYV